MRKSNKNSVATGLTVVLLLVFMIGFVMVQGNVHQEYVKVTGLERLPDRYLVYAELRNGRVEVFENTDNILYAKYESSTLQAQLLVDHYYYVNVVGYRFGPFDWYRNIINAVEDKSNGSK